ncbi:MAG: AraC family transcriptional regulator [Spirosomataceae bacterium]
MKTEFEVVRPDEGSSFRVLHNRVSAEDFKWEYHYHPEYEIVCVLYGDGRRHVGTHMSHYTDGDLVLIGPNLPHAGFGNDVVGPHEEIVVQLAKDFFDNSFLQKPEMQAIQQLLTHSQGGVSFHGQTKTQLKAQLQALKPLSSFDRLLALLSILQQLALSTEYTLLNANGVAVDFNQKDEQRLKRIFEYVELHYQDDIALETVAEIANLTVPSFCTYFKKKMNMTFSHFVNHYRINHACKLLATSRNITDICYLCGFQNISYFNRTFKTLKQQSPLQYRKHLLRQK